MYRNNYVNLKDKHECLSCFGIVVGNFNLLKILSDYEQTTSFTIYNLLA